MKKKLAGLLVAMMVLTMGTTVFASQSPTSEATAEQKAQQLRDSVSTVESGDAGVKVDKVDASEVADANKAATGYSDQAEVLGMVELKTDKDISKGVTITIYVAGVKSGDNIRILHKLSNGTWEVIVPYVGDGFVRATFYSLSPIAIVKYPASASVPSSQQVPSNVADDSANKDAATDASKNEESEKASAVSDNDSSTAAASDSDSDSKSTSSSKSGNSSSKSTASAKTNVNVNVNTSRTNSGSKSGAATSPKTGQEMPVLPCVAIIALMGATVVCSKKIKSL